MSRRYVNPALPTQAPSSTPQYVQPGAPPPPVNAVQEEQFPWGNPKILNPDPPSNGMIYPPYFRPVTTYIPANKDLYESSGVTLGLTINPCSVTNAPVFDSSQKEIIRCTNCLSYLSPFVKPKADEKSYQCPVCGKEQVINSNILSSGILSQSPELTSYVYDYIAPPSYDEAPHCQPCFGFMIDTSSPAFSIGFTQQFVASLKANIDSIPDTTLVSLIVINNRITIYDLANQQQYVCADISDVVVPPSLTPFPIGSCKEQFIQILDEIIENGPVSNGHCLPSALIATEYLFKDTGAILIVGVVDIPTIGPFALKAREITPETDELSLMRLPPNSKGKVFRELSFKMSHSNISYHLFAASSAGSPDLPIISIPSGLTGGTVHYYGPQFTQESCITLHADLYKILTSQYFYKCTLRLRASPGIKILSKHGNFIVQQKEAICFPINSINNCVTYEILVDNPINSPHGVFQLAMVWTNAERQRMIRVFTFAIPVTSDPIQLKQSVDEGALATLLIKSLAFVEISKGTNEAQKLLHEKITKLVSHGIKPPSIYYLSHAISVCPAFLPNHPLKVDGRFSDIVWIRAAGLIELLLWVYPRMIALDTGIGPLPLNSQAFTQGNVFLLHNNQKVCIWVNANASPEYLMQVFGVSSYQDVPSEVPTLSNQENEKVHQIINECWNMCGKYLPVEVFCQGNPKEIIFGNSLIDEYASSPQLSYSTWRKGFP